MAEKVKVSREVEQALNAALEEYDGDKNLVIENHNYDWVFECAVLNNFDTLEIARMLINDYEVEQTPEEEIAEVYQEAKQNFRFKKSISNAAFNEGICDGIITTLDLLNIKIDGVNE